MRILLTNDDGVRAPGILAMFRQLSRLGEVTVVAPEGERSSISQAITLNQPVYHHTTFFEKKILAHVLSGTPADCVKFGVAKIFRKKPDLIVSGINHGSNDGCSVFYSGTVGAAREGALLGIPSIAVSLDSVRSFEFAVAAKVGLKAVRWAIRQGLPKGTFLNVNIPDVNEKDMRGLLLTSQCRVPIHGEFCERKDPAGRRYYWLTGRPPARHKDSGTDSFALQQKFAVMTPILCDATDYSFLNQHRGDKCHDIC
ncbi:MAG: 5'/3'-nucleotidase SurE [Candidatus Omnitrophota bacterium]